MAKWQGGKMARRQDGKMATPLQNRTLLNSESNKVGFCNGANSSLPPCRLAVLPFSRLAPLPFTFFAKPN
jgi:hypothetical protein